MNLALLCGVVSAQQQLPPPPPEPPKNEQAPPEEDESVEKPKEYAFNPLQAEKELKVGNFYFKKGSYKAAASRFREATHWNPGLAEPYYRLGEAEEKLRDMKSARAAYAKFVELAPEDKRAETAKKKMAVKKK